jgi:hypothetical protein
MNGIKISAFQINQPQSLISFKKAMTSVVTFLPSNIYLFHRHVKPNEYKHKVKSLKCPIYKILKTSALYLKLSKVTGAVIRWGKSG